eukprot:TRINITY_DN11142_c0_g1_i6.p1 TRINITY_DN11142_c0_g1~~TRINITY_DN11142_c0_g1_i6.p1  ORF type:complete len:158 (+),score=34.91 TRINITY_DN11142_c0_g1_i6:413-886(+)
MKKSQVKASAAMNIIEQLAVHASYAAAIQELLSKKVSALPSNEYSQTKLKRKRPDNPAVEKNEVLTLEGTIAENVNKIHIACQKLRFPCEFQEERCPNGMQKATVVIESIVYGEGCDVSKKKAKYKATQVALQSLCSKYGADIVLSKSKAYGVCRKD